MSASFPCIEKRRSGRFNLSAALCIAALSGALTFSGSADAAVFGFSFDNENGSLAGTVTGTVTLPDGDGTFAASSVIVETGPAGLSYGLPFDFTSAGVIQNIFTVVAGSIDIPNSQFFGLFNGGTALSLNGALAGGATFIDALNGNNFGATGVRDADSSTLSFSSPAAISEPASAALLALGALGFAGLRRKQNQA